jgi:Flp pilus assembly protein TadB
VRKLRWDTPERPLPKHPYRDSALIYAGMAVVLFAVVVATGGSALRGVVAAAAVFVAATLYSWARWHVRLRNRNEGQE